MRELKRVKCSCGALMTRPPTLNKPFANVWKPLFLEHASHEGMWFNTKKELQDYCRKEKVSSAALL